MPSQRNQRVIMRRLVGACLAYLERVRFIVLLASSVRSRALCRTAVYDSPVSHVSTESTESDDSEKCGQWMRDVSL